MSNDLFLEHAVRSSLVDLVDKRLIVVLRDGRNILGWLRSFDQYSNVVLENCVERLVAGNEYADDPAHLMLVRGENVVMMGEVDEERYRKAMEVDKVLTKADVGQVRAKIGEAKAAERKLAARALVDPDDRFDPLL